LLIRVAIELAVFLLGDACTGGEVWLSLLLEVLRESHEKGLVSFRVGGCGLGSGGGEATAANDGLGLFAGDSAGGDQGMEGKALVRPPRDSFLPDGSFSAGLCGSATTSA